MTLDEECSIHTVDLLHMVSRNGSGMWCTYGENGEIEGRLLRIVWDIECCLLDITVIVTCLNLHTVSMHASNNSFHSLKLTNLSCKTGFTLISFILSTTDGGDEGSLTRTKLWDRKSNLCTQLILVPRGTVWLCPGGGPHPSWLHRRRQENAELLQPVRGFVDLILDNLFSAAWM